MQNQSSSHQEAGGRREPTLGHSEPASRLGSGAPRQSARHGLVLARLAAAGRGQEATGKRQRLRCAQLAKAWLPVTGPPGNRLASRRPA